MWSPGIFLHSQEYALSGGDRMKKTRAKETSFIKASLLGSLVSVVLSTFMAAIVSLFIFNEYMDLTSISKVSYILIFIAVFIGAIIGGSMVPKKKWQVHLAVGGIYYLFSLCVAMGVFEGIGGGLLLGLLACILAVLGAVFAGKSTKKRNSVIHRKTHSR